MPHPTLDPYICDSVIITERAADEAIAGAERYLTENRRGRVQQTSSRLVVVGVGSRLLFRLFGVFTSSLPAFITVRATEDGDRTRLDIEFASDQGWYLTGLLPMAQRVYRQRYDDIVKDLCDVLDGQAPNGPTRLRPPS